MRVAPFVMLFSLLIATTSITAQNNLDPDAQCAVTGRGPEGPLGEIQCRENALKKTPSNSAQVPARLFRLAGSYEGLSEIKAEESYRKLIAEHCTAAPNLCNEARKRLTVLEANRPAPLQINTPFTSDPYSFAISPDGKVLVYLASVGAKSALWLHDLDTGKAALISGTESEGYGPPIGGAHPFWSPDGKSIGFFLEGKLKIIAVSGGVAKTLADAPLNYGGSWSRDNVIVFVPDNRSSIYQIRADGGDPQPVTERSGVESHRFPQFLTDGRHFLFYRTQAAGLPTAVESPLAIGSLESMNMKPLSPSVQAARFVSPDQLLMVGQGALFAQRLDPASIELTGARILLTDRVADYRVATTPGYAALSVSDAGSVAYRSKDAVATQLFWFDRSGRQVGRLGQSTESADVGIPRFSPEGRTVAVVSTQRDGAYVRLLDSVDGATRSIFLADTARLRWDAFTWASNGDYLVFSMTPPTGGLADLYKRSLASGVSERLPGGRGANKVPTDSSPNGEYLLYTSSVDLVGELHALPLSGGAPVRIAEQTASGIGRFSADGRWVAYQRTNATTGRKEICIQPFPSTSSSLPRISFSGRSPEWSRDGRELYYVSSDNRLMAVPVKLPAQDSESIEFGMPTPLFPLPEASTYVPAPDGQRFLLNVPTEGAPPIYILSNWTRSTGIAPVPQRRP